MVDPTATTVSDVPLLVEGTTLEGVQLITPPFLFEDTRGVNVETYNAKLYRAAGIDMEFVQDSFSHSRRNVLRGIHGDRKTWKLISCPHGRLFVVVVNNDPASAQFRKWETFDLSGDKNQQLLVPPGFGNGHLVVSPEAIFAYKLSAYTDTEDQFSLPWNDPALAIPWPVEHPILSDRDRDGS